jgi:hypothetical protein
VPPHLLRAIWLLLILASISVGRAAVSQNIDMLSLRQYAHLAQPTPYQNRILMAPLLRWAGDSPAFNRVYQSGFHRTLASPEDLAVMLVNCASLLLLLPVTVALRRQFSPAPRAGWLACLLTLLVVTFTYVVRYEWRWSMPYDLLSLLMFTLGLLAVARRQGWLLLLVVAAATPNRETIVFLIPIWFWLAWREQRPIAACAYSLAAFAEWFAWRTAINHILGARPALYDFPWKKNLSVLYIPTHWPQLLSVFGFLLIPMWMLRSFVPDRRLHAVWLATGPYLLAALIVGIWYETRIFGELSALVGVTFAIELEAVLRTSIALPVPGLSRS